MARATRKKPKSKSRPPRHAAAANDDAGEAGPQSHRPLWEGHLRLSLVSCAVALYSATTHVNDIAFHLLNPKTKNRIRMIPTDPETGPVERADLVKGYEIEKNRYVIIAPDELDAVKLETTHTLDIERFVDADAIDRLYWNDPFYLVPADKSGIDAYTVIRDAMAAAKRIALGRLVLHSRERLMAVEPRGKGLLAYSLRMRDEVVDPERVFDDIPKEKPDSKMISVAEMIIAQQEGAFEPNDFKDRYEAALRALIAHKERGAKPVTAAPPKDTNVIDLMDALKRSLQAKGAQARRRNTR